MLKNSKFIKSFFYSTFVRKRKRRVHRAIAFSAAVIAVNDQFYIDTRVSHFYVASIIFSLNYERVFIVMHFPVLLSKRNLSFVSFVALMALSYAQEGFAMEGHRVPPPISRSFFLEGGRMLEQPQVVVGEQQRMNAHALGQIPTRGRGRGIIRSSQGQVAQQPQNPPAAHPVPLTPLPQPLTDLQSNELLAQHGGQGQTQSSANKRKRTEEGDGNEISKLRRTLPWEPSSEQSGPFNWPDVLLAEVVNLGDSGKEKDQSPEISNDAAAHQPNPLERLDNLIISAKENDKAAQTELLTLHYCGLHFHYLTPKKMGFMGWKDIQNLCYHEDLYAYYVISNRKRLGFNFPSLFSETHKRADDEHPETLANLAYMYSMGLQVKKNKDEATRLLKQAADLGSPYAQFALGRVTKNNELIERVAMQGFSFAQSYLGKCYAQQLNYQEAYRWYKIAADQGDSVNQVFIGDFHKMGLHVPKNLEEASRWYKLAADQGDPDGQFCLGSLYRAKGDHIKAVELYTQAASKSHKGACSALADMYKKGEGAEKDHAKALYYTMQVKAPKDHSYFTQQLSVLPFVSPLQASFREELSQIDNGSAKLNRKGLNSLSNFVNKQMVVESQQEFKIAHVLQLYKNVKSFLEEGRKMTYKLASIKPAEFMLPGIFVNTQILQDFHSTSSPIKTCLIENIEYLSFGEKNIKRQNKFLLFISQLDQKFATMDSALQALQIYYGKEEYDAAIKELLVKRRNPEAQEECTALMTKIAQREQPIMGLEQMREELLETKETFKALLRSTGRSRQDAFREEYPFFPLKK
jgi:TPR repeat protein